MTHRDIFEDEGCQLVFLKMRIVEIDLMYVLDKYFKTAYRIVVLVSGKSSANILKITFTI